MDKAWHIVGLNGIYLIAIECLLEVNTDQIDPKSYWVDEPISQPICEEEFYKTRQEAEIDLMARYNTELETPYQRSEKTLEDWRELMVNSFVHTEVQDYKKKEYGVEWFIPEYIIAGKKKLVVCNIPS